MKKRIAGAVSLAAAIFLTLGVVAPTYADEKTPDSQGAIVVRETTMVSVDGVERELYVVEAPRSGQEILVAGAEGVEEAVAVDDNDLAFKSQSGAAREAELAKGLSWYNWVAPGDNAWHTSVDGASLMGSPGYITGYTVNTCWCASAGASIQARGFKTVIDYNHGTQYVVEIWEGIGYVNGGGSSIGGSVVWGNAAASKKIMMKSGIGVGSSGDFQ